MNENPHIGKRWVDKIYPSEKEFLSTIRKNRLKIYHGIDPTGPDLHLGHSTNLLLLEHFRRMGHEIVLLIGDFTAMIGDPTERKTSRKTLTHAQVLKNAQTYKAQAGKILSFTGKNPTKIVFNSRWWGKMKLSEMLSIQYLLTAQQIIERDMFQKRIKAGDPISLAEIYYPLLQGYDSVALDIDAEVGGTDQTFNMLVGRDLLKKIKNKEKFVITTKLLENPKTGRKLMSKSEGNYVALSDPPDEMFAKVMALPDEAIISCFELCTEVSDREIKGLKKEVEENPLHAKKHLAFEIVKIYHGGKGAAMSQKEFERVFQAKGLPEKVPEVEVSKARYDPLDLLVETKLAPSRSEARRLISQGAVEIDGKKLEIGNWKLEIRDSVIIRVGKHRFARIKKGY